MINFLIIHIFKLVRTLVFEASKIKLIRVIGTEIQSVKAEFHKKNYTWNLSNYQWYHVKHKRYFIRRYVGPQMYEAWCVFLGNGAGIRRTLVVASHRRDGSDNLYRTAAVRLHVPPGRSRINIRWLISFRADQGVAFFKFPANCPFTHRHFLVAFVAAVPSLRHDPPRAVSSYYFRHRRWYPFSAFNFHIDGCDRTVG